MEIENHKYKLRLVSFYDEIVMDVVHVYFEREILDKDSLFIFLDRNAHILFHKYISTTPCCKCVKLSLAAPGKKNPLTQAQFNLLYDCNGDAKQGHEKMRHGNFVQHCLCKISPKSSVSVLDMDIILICIIIKECYSYPGNPQWLEDIKNIRNFLSHIGESATLSENDFNDKWKMLELSVLEISRITGPSYENSVKKRILSLKEQHKKMDNLTDTITMCNEISEIKILEALRNFGVQIDNLSLQIKKAKFCPTDDSMIESADSKKPRLENLEEDQSNPCSKESKCRVTWKFATPGHWDVKEMVTKLSHLSALLEFKVEFVYEGSLVVRTSAAIDLLYDEKKLTTALSKFVQRLLEECEIDFTVKDEVEVDIIIEYYRGNDTEYISVSCPTCEEKDSRLNEKEAELTRHKNVLNVQLEREYDKAKFEMSQKSLSSLYLEKSLSMDELLLGDLVAKLEHMLGTKFIKGSYSEYSRIEPAFTATADVDKSLESTELEEENDSASRAKHDLDDVCSSSDTPEDKTALNAGGMDIKERENFNKNSTLIVEHTKDGFTELIDLNVTQVGYGSFESFINAKQHDIYHLCYNRSRCCQCTPGYTLPNARILHPFQLELLLGKNGPKKMCHNPGRTGDFCCCFAHRQLTTSVLDVTLARCLLVNFCQDVFWYSCLTAQKQTLEDFLTRNKHNIYHLYDINSSCCQCPSNYVFPTERQIITKTQWNQLFNTPCLPCQQDRKRHVGGPQTICSSSVTPGIHVGNLGADMSQFLIDHCCTLKKSVEKLAQLRNNVFGHIKEARISDNDYAKYRYQIEYNLLLIARICNKESEVQQNLRNLDRRKLDGTVIMQTIRDQLYTREVMADEMAQVELDIKKKFLPFGGQKDETRTHDFKLTQHIDKIEDMFTTLISHIRQAMVKRIEDISTD